MVATSAQSAHRTQEGVKTVEGWVSVADRLPRLGERVEVRHDLAHSYDCTGQYDGDGKWSCANAFIVPPGYLDWNPTHWRPKANPDPVCSWCLNDLAPGELCACNTYD